jgi:aspartate carbamoyltransferase regulatory subunit
MKRTLLFGLICAIALSACNNKKQVTNSDIGVAQAFIKDILENDFKEAETLVLTEETNKQYFDLFKKEFESKDVVELENYKNSEIIINEISAVSDSVSIINYSNSFKKDKSNKLKMVRVDGKWLVDLKYTFSGNL